MTAPKPQQMQSRKERLKTSTLRRRRAMTFATGSGDFADRNQGQLDTRLAQSHLVARVDAHAFGNALAIHEGAVVAVIDEHHFAAIAHECAMTPRHARKSLGQRQRLSGAWRTTDDERARHQ